MRRRHEPRRGTTAVECALCLPLLFLLVTGSIEFTRAMQVRHSLENAAYEAARESLVPGGTAAEARAEARRLLAVIGVRDAAITVDPPAIRPDTTEVTVTIRIAAERFGYLAPRFLGGKSIERTCTLRTERNAAD